MAATAAIYSIGDLRLFSIVTFDISLSIIGIKFKREKFAFSVETRNSNEKRKKESAHRTYSVE